jgi:hypothetical protein
LTAIVSSAATTDKEISAAAIKTNEQAPQAVKPKAKLERSVATDAGNLTAFLQATTGDANQRTAKTQNNCSRTIKRHKALAGFAVLALLIGAIGLGYYFVFLRKTASGADGKKSIAVLPLKRHCQLNSSEKGN